MKDENLYNENGIRIFVRTHITALLTHLHPLPLHVVSDSSRAVAAHVTLALGRGARRAEILKVTSPQARAWRVRFNVGN